MQSLSKNGCRFRTKLLTEERARRFAACLQANGRFLDVKVEVSKRASSFYRRHFVSYAPASEERQRELLCRQQDSRQRRAETEGSDYLFVLDRDSVQPFYWCYNPRSGETYEVTQFDCSCPDFRYRGPGVRCKHMIALQTAVQHEEVTTW